MLRGKPPQFGPFKSSWLCEMLDCHCGPGTSFDQNDRLRGEQRGRKRVGRAEVLLSGFPLTTAKTGPEPELPQGSSYSQRHSCAFCLSNDMLGLSYSISWKKFTIIADILFSTIFLVSEMKGRIRKSEGGSVLVKQLDTSIFVGEQLVSFAPYVLDKVTYPTYIFLRVINN